METNIKITVPRGAFHISIEELRNQLKGGNVNVGKSGVTHSKAGAVKVPEGTFHSSGIEGGINNLKGMFGFCDDDIEKAKAAAGRIYHSDMRGREAAQAEAGQGRAASKSVPVSGQWYEVDADRFALEVSEMDNRGFKLIDMFDGRIGFEKNDDANMTKITVICDWLYPVKPPAVYIESGITAIGKMKRNADGSLTLFSKYMTWKADMAVCTVIDYFEEKLELIKDLEPASFTCTITNGPATGASVEPENSELPELPEPSAKFVAKDNYYVQDFSKEEEPEKDEPEENEDENENNSAGFQILKSI